MNPDIDRYLERLSQGQSESKHLRTILLSFLLEKQLKWAQPCYSLQGKNVVLRRFRTWYWTADSWGINR